MSALNSHLLPAAPRFTFSRFAQVRAAMPQMPTPSTMAAVGSVAGRIVLATVPFGALGWMFIAY
jgi:hypothetical protein